MNNYNEKERRRDQVKRSGLPNVAHDISAKTDVEEDRPLRPYTTISSNTTRTPPQRQRATPKRPEAQRTTIRQSE
jgi:hypothetical protein